MIGSLDLGYQPLYLCLTLSFSREAKFRRQKKMDEKKQIRETIKRRNTGNYGQCRPNNKKSYKVRD